MSFLRNTTAQRVHAETPDPSAGEVEPGATAENGCKAFETHEASGCVWLEGFEAAQMMVWTIVGPVQSKVRGKHVVGLLDSLVVATLPAVYANARLRRWC